MRLRMQDAAELDKWLGQRRKWMSHDMQNEMLRLMAHSIQRSISSDIQSRRWYSLIVDEITDISVKEQISLFLRYVSEDFAVYEDFVGFYETENTDSASIVQVIEDMLLRLSLPIQDCRGQCYDGASNMAGRLSRVRARILDKCSKALYVHCCAHSLNLAVQDASRSVSIIRDVIDLVKELNVVVRASAKCHALFEKICHELLMNDENLPSSVSPVSLRQLCPTRWTVRAKSMASVVDNYDVILPTLDKVAAEDNSESGSKAKGLSKCFLRFATYFALKLGITVFQQAEQLSCLLQRKTLTAVAAKHAADALITSLQSIRNDKSFELFWNSTQSESQAVSVLPAELPRTRRPPSRFVCGSENVTFAKP